jgi:hypothetical protein
MLFSVAQQMESSMARRSRGIWRRFKLWARGVHWITARKIAIVLAGLMVILTVVGSRAQYGYFNLQQLFLDMWANWSAELASIVITVLVIDTLNQRRAVQQEKQAIIRQMASMDNGLALRAVRELEANGWLRDGSLNDASLFAANLEFAELWRADLRGADLSDANLKRAYLEEALFNRKTRLPDKNYWTPETDLTRFTNPEHPDFWRSDNPRSPAYQDKNTPQ